MTRVNNDLSISPLFQILCGAAILFYAFCSPDIISTTGEETKEPTKTLPTGICASKVLSTILLFCVTLALTLSYSWNRLSDAVAIPVAFENHGIEGAHMIITVGGVIALHVSCVCAMFPIPRIIYSMSADGLLPPPFKLISYHTKSPIFSTLFAWGISSILMLCIRLEILILMAGVSSIISSSSVSICVICLRYQQEQIGLYQEYIDQKMDMLNQSTEFVNNYSYGNQKSKTAGDAHMYQTRTPTLESPLLNGKIVNCYTNKNIQRESTYQKMDSIVNSTPVGSSSSLLSLPGNAISDMPTQKTWIKANSALVFYILASVAFAILLRLYSYSWWANCLYVIVSVILFISFRLILKQPKTHTKLIFQAPCVPVVPLVSLTMNIIILTALPYEGWIRFAIGLSQGMYDNVTDNNN